MHASVTGMGLSQGDFFLPAKYRPPSSPIARTPSNPQISEGTASEPLVLVVIRGEHLAPQSTFGFADPYIKIGLDGEPPVTSTQTTQKSPHSRPKLLGPLAQFQWQERLQCTVPLASSVVDLYCYDAAPLQSDELIGRGVVELGQRLEDEMWVPLHDTATGGRKGRVLICLHWPDRVKPRATAAAAAAAALGAALQEAARRSAEAEAARRAMCKRAAAGAATAALAAAAVHSAESIAAAEAAQAAAEAAARAAEAARQAALRSAAAAAAPACLIAAAADAATSIARAEAEAKARAEAQARLIAAVRAAGSAAVASAVVTAVALAPVPPPWIGFLVKQRKGKPVIIEDVAHDGPAEKCGLQDGDVMVSIAGDPIRTMKDFWRSMKKHKYIGNIIPVVVNRPKDPSMSFQDGDETAEVTVELEVGIKRRTVLANVPPLRTVADILPLLEDAAGLRLVVKSGFSTIDDDLSGLISDEEFKTGFREWLGPELSGYLTNEDVEDLWTKGDEDESGFLKIDEFEMIVKETLSTLIDRAAQGR